MSRRNNKLTAKEIYRLTISYIRHMKRNIAIYAERLKHIKCKKTEGYIIDARRWLDMLEIYMGQNIEKQKNAIKQQSK